MPTRLRGELGKDPLYTKGYCIYHDAVHGPATKIEWHHNFIFAGKQVQERWCILPIDETIHAKANQKQVRERLDWIMLNRADNDTLVGYSRAANLIRKRDQLNETYGTPSKKQRS